ncbi:MAG: hypothetical protein AB7L41_06800 [Flavobacteriaceae bacterium]
MRHLAIAAVAALTVTPAAWAASLSPPAENGRYQLQRTDEGYFRVDRETGRASLCKEADGAWSCRLLPDDRSAYEDELTRLNERIETLEQERDALAEQLAATGSKPEAEKPQPKSDGDKLSEKERDEIDKAMDGFEYMVRRFIDIMKDVKDDIESAYRERS